VTLRLAYRPPYDWDAILAFLRARVIPGVETVSDGRYARTIAVGGTCGVVMVAAGSADRLEATVHVRNLASLPAIIARIRRVFDLAADPAAIGAHLGLDPKLAPLIAMRPGLRVPGAWDGFELAVRAILGQQITVSAAAGLAGRLVAAYGEPLPDATWNACGLTHLFPSPARLATADLSVLGMPGSRRSALSSLAAAVVAEPAIFGPRGSLEEAIERLRSLPGVGEWTAQYIAMRELREPDAFPAADIGLLRAMSDAAGARPTPVALLARAEAWRPWRAYAAAHLWAAGPPVARRELNDRRAA
jgi:AraC family transcriptional regulator of adaptative response / DNA-3-methyladenine glycosylase II